MCQKKEKKKIKIAIFLPKHFVNTDSLLKFVMPKIAYSYESTKYAPQSAAEVSLSFPFCAFADNPCFDAFRTDVARHSDRW